MRIRTDDEVYRVDAVWLGPPKATFPFRARYVAWLLGIPIFLCTLTVERWLGIRFGVLSTLYAFPVTIFVTRLLTGKISHERPLSAVVSMWVKELTSPRERTSGIGGAASAGRVRVRQQRPLPGHRRAPARGERARRQRLPAAPPAGPTAAPIPGHGVPAGHGVPPGQGVAATRGLLGPSGPQGAQRTARAVRGRASAGARR